MSAIRRQSSPDVSDVRESAPENKAIFGISMQRHDEWKKMKDCLLKDIRKSQIS